MHERYLVILNFMPYYFVVLAWDHHLNQLHLAQSSPPLKNSHREEEVVSLHSANWLSLNWITRRKRISFVLGPELGFNWHTKREPISVEEEEEGGRRVKQRQAECQAVQWDVFLEPWPWTRQHLRYYQTYQINWPNQVAKLIEDV